MELPRKEAEGAPAGVKDATDDGGGPAGVVDRSPRSECLVGVEGMELSPLSNCRSNRSGMMAGQ